MDEQRSWPELLAGPVTGALIAAIVAAGLALAGPGRYYGWRLQKVLDLADKLQGKPTLSAQYRELITESERLSKRVAAYHRIPTEWDMYVINAVTVGLLYPVLMVGLDWASDRALNPWWSAICWISAGLWLAVIVQFSHWGIGSVRYTRQERYRFVHEGMPEDFERRYSPRPNWMKPRPSEWDPPSESESTASPGHAD